MFSSYYAKVKCKLQHELLYATQSAVYYLL